MKKVIELFGNHDEIEILPRQKLLRMDVRYIATDLDRYIDIYESNVTGELIGCMED